jgi:heme/copper-type cytochrome/quinol oxidase subunit 1
VPTQDRMTPRNVYLYLVCLVTLLVGVFAAVQLVQSAIGIAFPDGATDFGWTAYTPLEEVAPYVGSDQLEAAQREHEIKEAVTAGVTLLLAGGLYVVHWRRAQAERALPAAPSGPPAG